MPPSSQEYAPRLGDGLAFLNLFGLNSTAAKTCGVLVLALIVTNYFIPLRYPCRSLSSLMETKDQAKKLFDECVDERTFQPGEYDRFWASLQRITFRTSEIAYASYNGTSNGQGQRLRYFDDLKEALFLWKRLKDIVKCHREAQQLIRDLKMCLRRASHSRAEYELQRAGPLRRPHMEAGHGHDVDLEAIPASSPRSTKTFDSIRVSRTFFPISPIVKTVLKLLNARYENHKKEPQ
ncbi:hypothetical protein L218DRAFT_985152 [Marasmius fiardii PR-910]|nr:hypothetical protein L218DRAFT_985152 [Marasmius fiardii PR-910]